MRFSPVITKLSANGYRITLARRKIIKIFSITKRPISANEIITKLKAHGVKVNKTTVYREINFLLEQNVIRRLRIKQDKLYYESSLREHHHLICKRCDSILDIQHAELEMSINKLIKEVDIRKGFSIKEHSIEFYGLCNNCQQQLT